MRARLGRLAILCTLLTPSLVACTLFSIRTPDKPLPQRELNARMLTREFAADFTTRVEAAADDIATRSADPEVQLNALRWKLGASNASQHAATQMAPMMALLDTWALAEQMRQFFGAGAGATLFGAEQATARELAETLASGAERLARGLTPAEELERFQSFVERYTREYPLTDLGFARVSVVDQWVTETNQQATLLETVGTVSQAMTDVADRMRLYGEHAPTQAVWEAQLAIRESGYGRADLVRGLARVDESLDRLSRFAESSPEQVHAAIADLRTSMLMVTNRFEETWALVLRTVHEEREALAVNVRVEREAAVQALDVQRAALAEDASRIADQVVASGGAQVRGLAREWMLYGILLYVVILGAPFAAGYYVGRLRALHASK